MSNESMVGGILDGGRVKGVPTVRLPKGKNNRLDVRAEGTQVDTGVWRLARFVLDCEYVAVQIRSDHNGKPSKVLSPVVSIGRNRHDGRVEAALDSRYEGSNDWECLFPV